MRNIRGVSLPLFLLNFPRHFGIPREVKTLLICSIICTFSLTALAEDPQVGRYQLVVGKLDLLSLADAKGALRDTTINTVFKIDSVTAQTWYAGKMIKGSKDNYLPDGSMGVD